MLLRGAALACLLASLTSCAGKTVVRTETVEVKVPVTVPVEARLTKVPPEPKVPAGTLINDDLVEAIKALQAWGRGLAKQLGEIAGLVPAEGADGQHAGRPGR